MPLCCKFSVTIYRLASTSSKLTKKCMYEVIQKVGSSIRSCGYGQSEINQYDANFQGVKCGIYGANCPGWIISMEITFIFRDEHNADPVVAVEFLAKYCKRAVVTLGHNGCIAKHGKEQILNMGFNWDTSDMSILMLAKLAKPLMGTTRIMINSLHIKGDLLITPILDGKALMYSFSSKPEVRIEIAFGSGGTEVPGVSSWLVRLGGFIFEKAHVYHFWHNSIHFEIIKSR
ncbi:hypothetical protein Ahy_A09g045800 isoform C [Arachis hypogaea]|uniref:Uncharacterized protein n=1 Tax=Arachis hypogaea TaxID=3818 RepID=A0A445BN77_ARAHY|nr:hypothetical protein Ahy_A09g045800 isoform C [Arachis hypogaea]